jgi:hypothetical protein
MLNPALGRTTCEIPTYSPTLTTRTDLSGDWFLAMFPYDQKTLACAPSRQ